MQGSKLQPDINSKTLNSQFGWLEAAPLEHRFFCRKRQLCLESQHEGWAWGRFGNSDWCVRRLWHTKRTFLLKLRLLEHNCSTQEYCFPSVHLLWNPSIPRPNSPNQGWLWAWTNCFSHKHGSVPQCRQWATTPPGHTYTFSPFLSLFLPLCNPPLYPGSWAKKIWTKSPEQLVSVRGPCQNTNTNLLLLFSRCVCMASKDSRQVFQDGSFRAQMNTSYEPFKLPNPTSHQQLGLKASARGSFASLFLTM